MFLRSIAEGNATIHSVAAGLRALRCVAVGLFGWIAEGNATDRWTVASVFRWKAASVNRWIAEGPGVAERSGATPGSVQRVVSQAFAERLARTGACTGEDTQRYTLRYTPDSVIGSQKSGHFGHLVPPTFLATPPTTHDANRAAREARNAQCAGADFPYPFPYTTMENSQSTNKPLKVFRARGITASVFAYTSKDDVCFHKVCLHRTYRVGKEWRTTDTFARDEAPVAMHLMLEAWQFILDTEEAEKKNASKED